MGVNSVGGYVGSHWIVGLWADLEDPMGVDGVGGFDGSHGSVEGYVGSYGIGWCGRIWRISWEWMLWADLKDPMGLDGGGGREGSPTGGGCCAASGPLEQRSEGTTERTGVTGRGQARIQQHIGIQFKIGTKG